MPTVLVSMYIHTYIIQFSDKDIVCQHTNIFLLKNAFASLPVTHMYETYITLFFCEHMKKILEGTNVNIYLPAVIIRLVHTALSNQVFLKKTFQYYFTSASAIQISYCFRFFCLLAK